MKIQEIIENLDNGEILFNSKTKNYYKVEDDILFVAVSVQDDDWIPELNDNIFGNSEDWSIADV